MTVSIVHNDLHEPWFDEVRVVDSEWVELGLTTPQGERIYYRIPRRTLFRGIDEVLAHPAA